MLSLQQREGFLATFTFLGILLFSLSKRLAECPAYTYITACALLSIPDQEIDCFVKQTDKRCRFHQPLTQRN